MWTPRGPEVALARMGSEGIAHLVAMLEDPSGDLWLNALGGLNKASPAEIKRVLAHIEAKVREEDENVRTAAIEVLIALRGDCVSCLPALEDALRDESIIVANVTLTVLEHMGPRAASAYDLVIEMLDYGDERIEKRAATVLGAMQADPQRVMPALAEAVAEKTSEAAARALARFGDAAVPDAVRVLQSGDEDVRFTILLTLEALGPAAAAAMPQLIEQLAAEDPRIRARALRVIGGTGAAGAAAVPTVLEQMGRASQALESYTIAEAFVGIGSGAEAPLRAALASKNAILRRNAAAVLSHMQGRTAHAFAPLFGETDRVARELLELLERLRLPRREIARAFALAHLPVQEHRNVEPRHHPDGFDRMAHGFAEPRTGSSRSCVRRSAPIRRRPPGRPRRGRWRRRRADRPGSPRPRSGSRSRSSAARSVRSDCSGRSAPRSIRSGSSRARARTRATTRPAPTVRPRIVSTRSASSRSSSFW